MTVDDLLSAIHDAVDHAGLVAISRTDDDRNRREMMLAVRLFERLEPTQEPRPAEWEAAWRRCAAQGGIDMARVVEEAYWPGHVEVPNVPTE